MICIKILPQNTNFCMKNYKFIMTWIEIYMYCFKCKQFFGIVSLVDKLLTCIRYLRKKE